MTYHDHDFTITAPTRTAAGMLEDCGTQPKPETIADAAIKFRAILDWLWGDGRNLARPRAVLVKLVALTVAVKPELLSDDAVERIGASKQSLSNAKVALEEKFGLQSRRSRTPEARQRMAAAMTASWLARHGNGKAQATE